MHIDVWAGYRKYFTYSRFLLQVQLLHFDLLLASNGDEC